MYRNTAYSNNFGTAYSIAGFGAAAPTNGATPEAYAGGEVEAGYRAAFKTGAPVMTGLLGVGVGVLVGFLIWGR